MPRKKTSLRNLRWPKHSSDFNDQLKNRNNQTQTQIYRNICKDWLPDQVSIPCTPLTQKGVNKNKKLINKGT